MNVCDYTKTVPIDPLTGSAARIVTTCSPYSAQNPGVIPIDAIKYWLVMSGSDYKIFVRQESKSNADKVAEGSGSSVSCEYVEKSSDFTKPEFW